MHRVSVSDCQSALSIDASRIRRVVKAALRHCQVEQADISIAIVDDESIHQLNRRHLQHDYPTDVLSFAMSAAPDPLEAEVVVSSETAIREAGRFGWDADAELLLYVTHGVLHACGHDDHSAQDRAAMRRAECEVLQNFGLSPKYDDGRVGPMATRSPSRRMME